MAQRTRRVEISLRRPGASARSEEIELTDADLLLADDAAPTDGALEPASGPVEEEIHVEVDAPVASWSSAPWAIATLSARASSPAIPADVAPAAPPEPVAPAPSSTAWRGTARTGLGKDTLIALAPILVKPLARPAAPPPVFPRSPGLLMAAAAVATILLSASAALAWV